MTNATNVSAAESPCAAAVDQGRAFLVPLFNVALSSAAAIVFLAHLLVAQFVLAWFRRMWTMGDTELPMITFRTLEHVGSIRVFSGILAAGAVAAAIWRPRKVWPLSVSGIAILVNLFMIGLTVMAIVVPTFSTLILLP